MKKSMILILLAAFSGQVFADNYVRGYTRSDGTYVQPHYRSEPNQYKYDNYSSQGNSNPHTGTLGTQRNEYSNPPSYNKSYNKTPCYGYGCKDD
jgi:hypothetical protein